MRRLAAAVLIAWAAATARAAVAPRAADLSVEELAGQVFMIPIDTGIAAARAADIGAGRLGGGLLRWDKFTGEEARDFAEQMRRLSAQSPHRIPFWLSTDHEGGPAFTQRRYAIAPFPGNMALGAAGSERLARDSAAAMARGLRAIGVSITFAPDLDVNNNPANPIIGLRSFGENPAAVARLGRAAVRGYRDGGLLAVPKHFPGHGDTADDSHLGLPVSTKTLEELEAVELLPFRAAFAAGAEAVMPAHMVFPALGARAPTPVTLSSATLDGFLREKLGFQGLVFSDSLDMGAISGVYGSSEAAVLSLLAGNDVLLLGKGDFPSALTAVVDAVKSGRLPRARLEKSVTRILNAKRRLGLFRAARPSRPLDARTLARDAALARRAAENAVTLVRDEGILPLKLGKGQTLGLALIHSSRYAEEATRFADEIKKRHPRTEFVDIPALFPSSAVVLGAALRLSSAAVIIVGTYQFGAPTSAAQAELVRRLIAGPAPVVAVSLMNPYDLPVSSGARAALCAYGMTDEALRATAEILFGEKSPRGRLPVSVPGMARRGDGLIRRRPERP